MSDVARLAGVSHQTVSRVINDSEHVREETRERVLRAMRQLDYRPNSVARALVTGRSNTLGVVSFDTTLYGPASTLYGIEQAAHEAGYFITIASLKAFDRASVLDAVERLRILGVDGILVIAPQETAARALLRTPAGRAAGRARGRAHATSSRSPRSTSSPAPAAATRTCSSSVIARVAHVAGPGDWLEAQQRVAGLARHARGRRASRSRSRWPATGARARATRSGRPLAADARLTAVFVANDQMALGVLRALHEAGRRIPGGRQRRRVRRCARGAVLHSAADDDPPGLRRDGPPRAQAAAGDDGGPGRCRRGTSRSTPELIVRSSTAPPP